MSQASPLLKYEMKNTPTGLKTDGSVNPKSSNQKPETRDHTPCTLNPEAQPLNPEP